MSGRHPHRKVTLRGWVWWGLLLVPPVAALALDTWLNVETYRNDYEVAEIIQQQKELSSTLDALKVEAARLEALDRIEIEAPDLGLVEPEPGQIQVIYCAAESGGSVSEPVLYTVARLDRKNALIAGPDAGRSDDTPWHTDSDLKLSPSTRMGYLLKRAIDSACAAYLGDS